jgi:hypothetical protein
LQNWLFKEPREWNGHFLRCSQYLVEMKNSSSQSGLKIQIMGTSKNRISRRSHDARGVAATLVSLTRGSRMDNFSSRPY